MYTCNAKNLKKIILYISFLIIGGLLIRYTYGSVSVVELIQQLKEVNLSWLVVSVCLGLASHLVRAYRWNVLLYPLGFSISLWSSFLALLVGYMSNVLVPRLGEVVRCSMLHRSEQVPISVLIGTLAIERILDFLGFIVVLILTCWVSYAETKSTLCHLPIKPIHYGILGWTLLAIFLLVLIGFILYYTYKQYMVGKWGMFIASIKESLYTMQASQQKRTILFLTIFKWFLYYLSDYVGVFAIAGTSPLDWRIGLSILTMSSISVAVPIQGGIGAYHMLVSGVLIAYGVPQTHALLYAGVIHAMHLLGIFIAGGLCFLFTKLNFISIER